MLLALAAAAYADDLVIEADRVVIVDGRAVGEGGVRLTSGEDRLEGASFSLDLATGAATIHDGTWARGPHQLLFAEATVDLRDGTGAVTGATLTGPDGLRLVGESLAWTADGTLIGERVNATLCDCAGAEPWSVDARHVELEPGEVLRFRGGVVRAFDVPVLPVPAGVVPLERRSGFLVPALGAGEDGAQVAVPLYLTAGPSADFTLTPEVRTARSLRLLAESRYALRGGRGITRGAVGWDWQAARWRGGADWDHGWSEGRAIAASQGSLTGDPAYYNDYGESFLARRQPWGEARTLAGWGPFEASSDVFRTELPVTQEVVTLAARLPERDGPAGLLLAAEALGGLRAHDLGELDIAAGTGASARRPTRLGPVVLTPGISGRIAHEREGLGDAQASMIARLPMWRTAGTAMEHLEPWVAVDQPLIEVEGGASTWAPSGPRVVPGLTWRRTANAAVAEVRGAVLADADAWRLRTDGWVQGGLARLYWEAEPAWTPGAPLSSPLAVVGAGLSPGSLDLDAAWIHAPVEQVRDGLPLHQARGSAGLTLPGPLATVRVSAGALFDLHDTSWLSRTAAVRWTHPTGCIGLGVGARFDADRAWPDLGLALDLFPR